MRKRIVSLLMALVMVFSLIPTTVFATEGDTAENLGKVHVIVENTTFTTPYTYEGDEEAHVPAWTGTIVDRDVPITRGATMMSCIVAALESDGYTAKGAEDGYISEITKDKKSLSEFDGGSGSGWMGTLNDWFTNKGFANFSVEDGDKIRVMYTCNYGVDIGGGFGTKDDTSLTALSFGSGKLTPEFSSDTTEYTLSLPDASDVTVNATAANKQNQVYLSVGDTSYRRTAAIPLKNGDQLTIRCGDTADATTDTPAVVPTTYTVKVEVAGSEPPAPVVTTANVTIRSQMAGGYLHGFAEPVEVASNLAESYGFTDSVDGVSALDVLVKAHEIKFGENFTDTASKYLAVGETGFVTKLFGVETSANSFALNQGYPNDGTTSSYGGYNGTTVTTTKVNNGDVLDFFIYQDTDKWSDYYTWVDGMPESIKAGGNITVTVTGVMYMGAYLYKTPAEMKAAAKPLKGVQLAWVDPATGAATKIEGAVTDADGKATITVGEDATGYLVATGTDDSDSPMVMNPSAPVKVLAGDSLAVTLTGLHDAQVKYLKLYTYKDGVKGEKNLLEGISTVADGYILKYNTNLSAGDYWVDGYDANDECNGGMKITVDADHTSFEIKRIYEISVNPSSWKLDQDYTLDIKVTGADNKVREIVLGTTTSGKGQAWEKTSNTFIFVLGDTVEATATPNAEKYPNYNPGVTKKTPTSNENINITCGEFVTVTIKAPAGSKITLGTLAKYYVYSYLDAEEVTEDETAVTATFHANKNTTYFYRVQNENGVTYWNYTKWAANTETEVTAEELHIGDTDFNKNTVSRFGTNKYDRADIYLNINAQDYKNMAVGETFELNSFRNWFLIESHMNSQVALPDMHYQVIDVNGDPSNVLTITPDEKNSCVANMTANKAGTAIVLVTYDAVTHMNGIDGGHEYSAIWPECTGVFIVTVGNDGTDIQTNMVLDRMDAQISKDEARQLDAEHDILFYLGSEGAEYSFKPEGGCTVTVARSTVSDKMTFSGFTNSGVTVAENGTVTITGLTTGRHIVKVEKGGKANYQVITARGVSYQLVDKDGNVLSEEAKAAIKAGDTVYLQFSNLVSPKEKLSGAYNFNFSLYYEGEDGTYFKSNPGGNNGVYDFSGNPARQKVAITIPKYWDSDSYTLTGAIKQGGYGGVPTHRGITYAAGTNPGFNAPTVSGILARLPEVTISLTATEFLTGKLTFKGSDGNAIDRTDLTVTLTDEDGKTTIVKDDGTFAAVAGTYTYTISGAGVEYTTGTVPLTAEGTKEFEIELTKTSDTAWDGKTQTEPAKDDENGVYRIGTGAELAWFVNASAKANVSGVLTADINLAKYAWLNVASNYKVELDGANHEITGLNAQAGLFKQINSNSHISSLTLRGTSASGGSVTGYASGRDVVIESCFSYVTINGSGSNVGGIVGYANTNATIRNCANFGDVTGSGNVGGIIGGFVGNGNTVIGCYNTGAITATGRNAGGIFGGSGYKVNVESCYNNGVVTAASNAGGIGGQAKGETHWSTGATLSAMTVTACYTTNDIAAFGDVHADSVTLSKCYSQKTDDANADALTADADLSDQFDLVCNGYPALKWQTNVTIHDASEETVMPPTCTEKGYTTHTCTKCGESYRDTYVDALGHDWCTHTAVDETCGDCASVAPTCTKEGSITRTCKREVCNATKTDVVPALGHNPGSNEVTRYPAYRTYTCAACGEAITEWNDERLQYVVMSDTGITSISMSDNGDYPWQYNEESEHFESTNAGVGNSTSETAFAFTLTTPAVLSFDYGVSSEGNYDKFTATLSNGTDTKPLLNGISGEKADSISLRLTAGTWTLTLKYTKDSSGNNGSDMAYIGNMKLEGTTEPVQNVANIYKDTGDYLTGLGAPKTGSIGGEWAALGLARSGRGVPNVETYYQSVVDYVKENINASNGRLNRNKSTENSRIILALTAIGKDVTDVGGYDLLKGLNNMSYINRQGTNGPVWALLALDSHNYPTSGDVTRDKLVDKILSLQMNDGSWYISSTNRTADVDMTAMAVQALAPYYNTNDAVKTAVDKALTYLSGVQKADGTFSETAGGEANSESTAQIVVMLCALGIDPVADARFTKNGVNVLDALYSFAVTDGGFKHIASDTVRNGMATEQGFYALAAYYRLKNGQKFLYDMTDVCITHEFGEWVITKEPTCTKTGTETRTCKTCGAEETRTVKANGHKFGAWEVSKAPTCTETGTEIRTCTVCQTTESRTVKALGHKFGAWTVTKAPTCTEAGTETRTCTVCQTTESRTVKALGHKFGAWTVTKEPTYTETGVRTRTCTVCGEEETQTIPVLKRTPAQPPVSKADSSQTTDGTVKSSETGDNSQMALWMSGALLSAAALLVLTQKKKRAK